MSDVKKIDENEQYKELHQEHRIIASADTPLVDHGNAGEYSNTQIKMKSEAIEESKPNKIEACLYSNTKQEEKIGNNDLKDAKENSDNINKILNENDIFDTGKEVDYSSDEVADSDLDSSTDSNSNTNSTSSSDSDDTSSSDDSDSEEEETDEGIGETEQNDDLIDADDTEGGPIRSKNEIVDEKVPTLPENFAIPEATPITYVGDITALVENSVIIKAKTSGEFKVLSEGTIFCLGDRTPLGPLYEVFGRLQSPVYAVKFNSENSFKKFENKKGYKVFYVNPTAEFLLTEKIRAIKGTDASNCNDEELPEEEQEFSDDEKESAAKKSKKRKRNKKDEGNDSQKAKQEKNRPASLPASVKGRLTSLPVTKGRLTTLPSVKGRLTSLPRTKSSKVVETSNITQLSNVNNTPQVNPMQFMQQFMGIMNQHSQNLPLQTEPQNNVLNQEQQYHQQTFYQQQQQHQQQQNHSYQQQQNHSYQQQQNHSYQQQAYQHINQQQSQQIQQPEEQFQQSYTSYRSPAVSQPDPMYAMQNILLHMQPQKKQAEYRQQNPQRPAVIQQQHDSYQQQYNYQPPNAYHPELPKQQQAAPYQYHNQNQIFSQETKSQTAVQQPTSSQNPAIMLAQLTSMLATQAQNTAASIQQGLENYPVIDQRTNSFKDQNETDDDYDPANI